MKEKRLPLSRLYAPWRRPREAKHSSRRSLRLIIPSPSSASTIFQFLSNYRSFPPFAVCGEHCRLSAPSSPSFPFCRVARDFLSGSSRWLLARGRSGEEERRKTEGKGRTRRPIEIEKREMGRERKESEKKIKERDMKQGNRGTKREKQKRNIHNECVLCILSERRLSTFVYLNFLCIPTFLNLYS